MILFETTLGNITIELFENDAPLTTTNMKQYVQDGFYDGTIFHRVIDGFMIQGGGFESGMVKKDTRDPIENEAFNGLANNRGTVAMARTSDPHSATAQFFINISDNDFLNFKSKTTNGFGYSVFGRVYDGLEIVDAIKTVETTSRGSYSDMPVEEIVIEKASIVSPFTSASSPAVTDSASSPADGINMLTIIVSLPGNVMLLKELKETVTEISHTIEYNGKSFVYSEIDSIITTVLRNNEFTAEFAQEITDAYPSSSGISYNAAVTLIGQSNLDATLLAVAGADGNYVG